MCVPESITTVCG